MAYSHSLRVIRDVQRPGYISFNLAATKALFSTVPAVSQPARRLNIDIVTGKKNLPWRVRQKQKRNAVIEARQGRRVAPGERKALRHRVVLSNNNAFEVKGLKELDITTDLNDPDVAGKMISIPDSIIAPLRVVEAFKPKQGWSLFRKPAILVKKEMGEVSKLMVDAAKNKATYRRIVVGERGSGKTVLLLQAMTQAFMNEWVVVNVPNCECLWFCSSLASLCENFISCMHY